VARPVIAVLVGQGTIRRSVRKFLALKRSDAELSMNSKTVTAATELQCTCLQRRNKDARHSNFCAYAVINSTVASDLQLPELDDIHALRVLTVRIIPESVCARVAVLFARLFNDIEREEPHALRNLVLFVKLVLRQPTRAETRHHKLSHVFVSVLDSGKISVLLNYSKPHERKL
jgi:hypothetical protein